MTPGFIKELRHRSLAKIPVSAEAVFKNVYHSGFWGPGDDRFFSGSGSRCPEIVDPYIAAVTRALSSMGYQTNVVDLGCGDFSVGSRIRPFCRGYIACDVVDALIQRNVARFSKDEVEFRLLNIINDDLPKADVAFVRQVFQHLSNRDIKKVLKKLVATYSRLIVTEQVPAGEFVPNLDHRTGADIRVNMPRPSGVVLTEPPFNLAAKQDIVLCEIPRDYAGRKAVIKTNLYKL